MEILRSDTKSGNLKAYVVFNVAAVTCYEVYLTPDYERPVIDEFFFDGKTHTRMRHDPDDDDAECEYHKIMKLLDGERFRGAATIPWEVMDKLISAIAED